MSGGPSPEYSSQHPDFSRAIQRAIQTAPLITDETKAETVTVDPRARATFLEIPDYAIFEPQYIAEPWKIGVADREIFYELLWQCEAEVSGSGLPNPFVDGVSLLDRYFSHEVLHGLHTEEWSNGQATNVYHAIFRKKHDADGHLVADYTPALFIMGPIRKVHLAMSAAMPPENELSASDWFMIETLGYSRDLDDLRARAEATPPVPPHYRSLRRTARNIAGLPGVIEYGATP